MKNDSLKSYYDDVIVRYFIYATLTWGVIAFIVGLWAALQLAFWKFNFDLEWLTFGRMRPLHTNAAIFAFGGNAIFAGIYHSTQRLCKTRMYSDFLSKIHFWGWQAIIVGAAITLPLGLSQSKEYAELEWPLDIGIALIWVIFAYNFFATLLRRKEKHIYVAIWFYIATIITVAVLHIVNSIEIPVSLFKSYPVYAGIQDAMVQWWYGHNAVAFFLTTPFLGLMYYYIPKAANRPVYSYRLSIVHFWALIFIYIWAGPHHLLNTSLPDWAQNLGMIFSVMLWAPSWGGMINGLLTLRGSWHLLRTEPVIKFLVTAVTFYGMSTFEGPLLSIKSVSALGHYTDWIIAHVHGGTLGWNGFLTFGMIYYLIPKLFDTKLYSKKLATVHFWVGLFGILTYYLSMWAAGITQGLMWQAIDASGKLVYPEFIDTVTRIVPLYMVRALGGSLYIVGALIMVYNLFKTIKGSAHGAIKVPVAAPFEHRETGEKETIHRKLEGMAVTFSVLSFIAIAVGSAIEIIPTLSMHEYIRTEAEIRPYSPLELAGRDIYIREGCYTCHSQMIRKLPFDVLRFGKASTIEESMYDRPFQWGSKRTGPDLSRVGKRYPHLWHFRHMLNPRDVIEGSIMPNYPWLYTKNTEFHSLRRKLSVMSQLGVPYHEKEVAEADRLAEMEAMVIANELKEQGARGEHLEQKEIVALIAYLQALGQLKK
ncbi:MAG: cytochrome C oxidase Cbb3 [Bdellovibrionaceae bacterium]|nr:cytochrome C oxidase Cbb3 [Pseudobdellovibrionaceae bacterium]|tara:strand:+ start:1189 stop:3303 length:2115 start_codon:yes stop_codon:yes gene_type:complete